MLTGRQAQLSTLLDHLSAKLQRSHSALSANAVTDSESFDLSSSVARNVPAESSDIPTGRYPVQGHH